MADILQRLQLQGLNEYAAAGYDDGSADGESADDNDDDNDDADLDVEDEVGHVLSKATLHKILAKVSYSSRHH